MKGLEVLVTFAPEIPTSVQGVALLRLEVFLRSATGLDVRVVKKLQEDDSKLRIKMTPKQRDSL
jgi:hypothetical protein